MPCHVTSSCLRGLHRSGLGTLEMTLINRDPQMKVSWILDFFSLDFSCLQRWLALILKVSTEENPSLQSPLGLMVPDSEAWPHTHAPVDTQDQKANTLACTHL